MCFLVPEVRRTVGCPRVSAAQCLRLSGCLELAENFETHAWPNKHTPLSLVQEGAEHI